MTGPGVLLVGRSVGNADRDAVARAGAECVEACDGSAALRVTERVRPSLVLLDADTAWRDGYGAACDRLKAGGADAPPVALLADPSAPAELLETCSRAGLDDCIIRPLVPGHVRARLESVAGSGASGDGRPARRVLLAAAEATAQVDDLATLIELNGYHVLRCHPLELPAAGGEVAVVFVSGQASELPGLLPRLRGGPALFVAPPGAARPAVPIRGLDWIEGTRTMPADVVQRINAFFGHGSRNLRAHARVPFFAPVEFREWNAAGAEWVSGYSVNVSSGGIFVRSLVPVRPRAPVEMRIHLSLSGDVAPATGVVVWAHRYGGPSERPAAMGVEFLGMPLSRQLAQLIEICQQPAA